MQPFSGGSITQIALDPYSQIFTRILKITKIRVKISKKSKTILSYRPRNLPLFKKKNLISTTSYRAFLLGNHEIFVSINFTTVS